MCCIYKNFCHTICDERETADASPCHAWLIVCISAKTAALFITRVDRRHRQQLSIVIWWNTPALDATVKFNSLQWARQRHTVSDEYMLSLKGGGRMLHIVISFNRSPRLSICVLLTHLYYLALGVSTMILTTLRDKPDFDILIRFLTLRNKT